MLDVKDILMMDTNVDTRARIELEEFAASRLTYILDETLDETLVTPEDRFYVGDKYKMQVNHPVYQPKEERFRRRKRKRTHDFFVPIPGD